MGGRGEMKAGEGRTYLIETILELGESVGHVVKSSGGVMIRLAGWVDVDGRYNVWRCL